MVVQREEVSPRRGLSLLMLFLMPAMAYATDAQVERSEVDGKTFSGVVRCMRHCAPQDARDLGMIPTGSEPVFDLRFTCRGIDEGWAIDYTDKRAREAMHGGIDIPAPKGTPILAIADGEVVGMFDNADTAVGIRIFLRHAPEETGKSFWVYSEYAHLEALPSLNIGQKVKSGDVVGRTSNTGISGQQARVKAGAMDMKFARARRDALHFSILYSESSKYFSGREHIVPIGGKWMDPVALYRSGPPYESQALAQLPAEEKMVAIPFSLGNGEVILAQSKLIWPYACDGK